MNIDEDALWRAVVECDTTYDGRALYAVKTVGVYCRPSCRSRTPLRRNVRFFEFATDAEAAGFRACKRCRPDLPDYAPMAELAEQARRLIDEHFAQREQLSAQMRGLGVTPNHLAAVFKRQFGVPPTSYLNAKRTEHACRLLRETDVPIVEIAFEVGFSSLSAFYTFFKRSVGTAPKGYRTSATLTTKDGQNA